jgi:hypothetical protein
VPLLEDEGGAHAVGTFEHFAIDADPKRTVVYVVGQQRYSDSFLARGHRFQEPQPCSKQIAVVDPKMWAVYAAPGDR